jgi:acyl-[acyl-carrier-protein]-phospholipid O-acyltransferase/long-chain-fatty-acid--[acyl-carrier-protein] ligase
LFKTQAKVITCYFRGANRLPFCPHKGWRKWFPRVSAHFSEVLIPPKFEHTSTTQARTQLTNWLRDQLVKQQFEVEMKFGESNVPAAILAMARQRPGQIILQDATTQSLTYRRLLLGADLLAQQWPKHLAPDVQRVGVLLPNVNATPVVLLSLWCTGKVPAILNFSTGPATMLACAKLAGLKQIITSHAFLERARLKIEPLIEAGIRFIYLEDIRQGISSGQKLLTSLRLRFSLSSALPLFRPQHLTLPDGQVVQRSRDVGQPRDDNPAPAAWQARRHRCAVPCRRCGTAQLRLGHQPQVGFRAFAVHSLSVLHP